MGVAPAEAGAGAQDHAVEVDDQRLGHRHPRPCTTSARRAAIGWRGGIASGRTSSDGAARRPGTMPMLVAADMETGAGTDTKRAPEMIAAIEAASTWCARRRRTPTRISSEPSRGTELSHSTVRRGSGPSGSTWLTRSSEVVPGGGGVPVDELALEHDGVPVVAEAGACRSPAA